MIAKAEEFAAVAQEMEDRLAGVGIAADDAGVLLNRAAGQAGDLATAMAKVVAPSEAAAGRLNDVRDSAAGAAAGEDDAAAATARVTEATAAQLPVMLAAGHTYEELGRTAAYLHDTYGLIVTSSEAVMASSATLASMNQSLAESFGNVRSSADLVMLKDAELVSMNEALAASFGPVIAATRIEAELQADLADHQELVARSMNVARDAAEDEARAINLLAQITPTAAGGLKDVAAATDQAGDSARRTYGWWRLSGNAIHWIISGSAELLAVLIPATVAAGAWAAAWLQGTVNVYQHIMSVYTATESMANMGAKTAGQMLGLGDALQKAQNEANPDVYQALGGAINVVRESAGGLAQVGVQIGRVFDAFMGKLVYDFSAAGHAGQTLGNLLHAMIPDLVGIGRFFGNIGAAIASLASQMPGLAEVLLHVLDIISGGIKDASEFFDRFQIGGWSILTVVMALEEFNRWGGLVANMLGKLGLGFGAVTGKFLSMEHFTGVFMRLFSALPLLVAKAMEGFGGLMARIAGSESAFGKLGVSIAGVGSDLEEGVAGIGVWQAALIAVAAVALAFLIDKLATAQTAAQKLGDAMQGAVDKASNMAVLSVISSNLSTLQARVTQTTAAVNKNAAGMDYAGGVAGRYSNAITATQSAYQAAGTALEGYRADQLQQVSDTDQVITGASQIAKAYGISIPAAMQLAQEANVHLTGAVQNAKGQWTALGEQVRDAATGFKAMGGSSGALGNDMLAVAIDTGEAGTKVQQLTQAWTAFMTGLTGGTSSMGAFEESLQNLGLKAASSAHNLGTATTFTAKSTKAFADDLTSYTGKGAQAWQNFDQVIGQTAPQIIEWMQMAGSEGALGTSGFQDIATVTRALGAQLVGLTRDSPAARSELGGLFQMAGYRGSDSFKALSHWIDKGNHSMKDASGIINKATGAMSNMEQVASNLGDVMNSQVTSAIDAAALSATHFTTYTGNLTKALANNGTYGGHTAAYWAEKAGAAYSAAGTDAADATGKISGAMQRAAASVAGAAGRIKDASKRTSTRCTSCRRTSTPCTARPST